MKKILFSLVALVASMSMNAQVMKVMKGNTVVATYTADQADNIVFEEEQEDGVTLTIAYPAQNTVDANYQLTGWEVGDEVTLYKVTLAVEGTPENDFTDVPAHYTGEGVAFTCTNASTGQFSGTLPAGESIDDYNLAIFGGTAVNYVKNQREGGINIKPTTWSSKELKDVVMMGAYKDGTSFTMEVINNVLKIENATAEDITVAWYGFDYGASSWNGASQLRYFELASQFGNTWQSPWVWKGHTINFQEHKDATDVPTFILTKNAVNYVNFPLINGYNGADTDQIGLYKNDGTFTQAATAVVTMKTTDGRRDSGFSNTKYRGHLEDAGTYNGNPL